MKLPWKKDLDPELNRQIKSAYEEGDYPLPDINAEWGKFASTLPPVAGSGAGSATVLKLIGVLVLAAVGVVAYLFIQNHNPLKQGAEAKVVNVGAKEDIKTGTAKKDSQLILTPSELNVSVAQTFTEGQLYDKQSYYAGIKKGNLSKENTNADHLQKINTSFREETKEEEKRAKKRAAEEVAKEEKDNNNDTELKAPVTENSNTNSKTNKEETAWQQKPEQKDSVKKIKPVKGNKNDQWYRSRVEFYLNTSNTLNSRITLGGGLTTGLKLGSFTVASGAMLGNRYQNISYINEQKTTLFTSADTPSMVYIHRDSFRMISTNSYYIGIPIEISWQCLKNLEIYGRTRMDFTFSQKYNYEHYGNYTDSGLLTGNGDYLFQREEKNSYRSFQTNLIAQMGLRYNYHRFSLGLCASKNLYNGSLNALEKQLKGEGMQVGQRFTDKMYCSIALGYRF